MLMESARMTVESSRSWVSEWDYFKLLILRPALAFSFVFLLISLGWFVAWKLVLVHVPLVQEIFGLRKKPVKAKPPIGRFSKFYNTINAPNSSSSRTNSFGAAADTTS